MKRYNTQKQISIAEFAMPFEAKLDEIGVIEIFQENRYMQYFLGLKGFIHKSVFDPSLLVYIRKRIDLNVFESLSDTYRKIARKEYLNRLNWAWPKERNIRHTSDPLGRKPVKKVKSYYMRCKERREAVDPYGLTSFRTVLLPSI